MKPGRINKIEAGQDEAGTVGSKPVVGGRHIQRNLVGAGRTVAEVFPGRKGLGLKRR